MVTVNTISEETNVENETFTVHKEFLCNYSPFFDAPFNGNFLEGTTQHVDPEVEPSVFAVFLDWIYTQQMKESESTALEAK